MRGQKGFTLIEMMVVVAICGLVLTISFPALSTFRGSICLEASAKALASDLRRTQMLAICSNENQSCDRFKFAKSGSALPGGSGTKVLSRQGKERSIVVSSMGRVRVE